MILPSVSPLSINLCRLWANLLWDGWSSNRLAYCGTPIATEPLCFLTSPNQPRHGTHQDTLFGQTSNECGQSYHVTERGLDIILSAVIPIDSPGQKRATRPSSRFQPLLMTMYGSSYLQVSLIRGRRYFAHLMGSPAELDQPGPPAPCNQVLAITQQWTSPVYL